MTIHTKPRATGRKEINMKRKILGLGAALATLALAATSYATLASSVTVSVQGNLATPGDLVATKSYLSQAFSVTLANGTSANQADLIFSDERTLAASGTEDLDLAGVLADVHGTTLTFARVKAIVIEADSANTNNVVVGGASSNGFINWVSDATDEIVIRPGGVFALAAPDATAYAVTASTGDLLTVTNSSSGTGVTYRIVIIGASA